MQSDKVIVGSFGSALNPEDAPLPEGALSGEARLRELEHLLRTATEVREQAEREMLNSTAAHEAARQRIAAAERMQHKAEQELVRLRTELAREELRKGKCWSPGDPLREHHPATPTSDFEVAMLTGTARPLMGSGSPVREPAQFSISEEQPARPAATAHRHPRSRTQEQKARKGRGLRGFALGMIVLAGIAMGAAATFFAVQSPEVREQIRMIPERIAPLLGEKAPAPAAPTVATPPVVETPAATAAPQTSSEDRAARRAAWKSAIAAEELRL
ncbi:MAG TPA: hypothetical protein ENJ05_06565, partial [Thiotrichales bacterium]|nr:hypothetical protein [Thiotrichales bacterium]